MHFKIAKIALHRGKGAFLSWKCFSENLLTRKKFYLNNSSDSRAIAIKKFSSGEMYTLYTPGIRTKIHLWMFLACSCLSGFRNLRFLDRLKRQVSGLIEIKPHLDAALKKSTSCNFCTMGNLSKKRYDHHD